MGLPRIRWKNNSIHYFKHKHMITQSWRKRETWTVAKGQKQRIVTGVQLVLSDQNWPKRKEVWRQM